MKTQLKSIFQHKKTIAILAPAIFTATFAGIAIAAESPTRAETERFIIDTFPLCVSRMVGEVNESIDIAGRIITINLSQWAEELGRKRRTAYVNKIDLTKVTISGNWAGVSFECEEAGCFTSTARWEGDDENGQLNCSGERGERLFKAFRHLQSFTGVPKPPLF